MLAHRWWFLITGFLLVVVIIPSLSVANVEVSSETIIRALDRNTDEDEEKLTLPVYEYLQMTLGDTENGGWSAHLYGWARHEMAGTNHFENNPDGELVYGYLQYSRPYSALSLNIGRRHIFAGVTNESIDGLEVISDLGTYMTASLFGGMSVGHKAEDGNTTYGGRLAVKPSAYYELALSYQKTNVDEGPDEKAGIDLSFNWADRFTFQGMSVYNIETQAWREHNYSALLHTGDFTLEPSFQFFSYNDYFGAGQEENNIFHFLSQTDETVFIAGSDLYWQSSGPYRLGARYNQYLYDIRRESASYYAGLMTIDLPAGSHVGAELGRMNGETEDNIYTLYRTYFYWKSPFNLHPSFFFSGDGLYLAYDAPVYGEDSAIHSSLSIGRHFSEDALVAKISAMYSKDPYFDDDVGGVLTITYKF